MRRKAEEEGRIGTLIVSYKQYQEQLNEIMDWICRGMLCEMSFDHCRQAEVFTLFHPDFPIADRSCKAPEYRLDTEAVIGNYHNLTLRQL